MKKIKILTLIISLIFIIELFSGCTSNLKNNKTKTEEVKGTLNIYAFDDDMLYLKDAAEQFKKKNPKVTINLNKNNIQNNLKTFLLNTETKDVPDIITMQDNYLRQNIKDVPNYFYNFSNSSNYINYKNAYVNEKLYAMPFYIEPVGILYRKDILKTISMEVSDIKTWDDYLEIGKRLDVEVHKKMIALSYSNVNQIYLPMLNQLKVNLCDSDGKYYMDSDNSIKVLNFIKNIFNQKINIDSDNKENIIDKFIKGDSASIICTPRILKEIESKAPNIKDSIEFAKLPAFEIGGNRDAYMPGMNLTINKLSNNKLLAVKFVNFLTSTEQLKNNFNKYGIIPAKKVIYTSTDFSSTDKIVGHKVWDTYIDIVKQSYQYVYSYDFNKIEKSMEEVLKKDIPSKDILKQEIGKIKEEIINKDTNNSSVKNE